MKQRCYNSNNPAYDNYGGRGIAVCDEWRYDQKAFIEWSLQNGYQQYLTIDRIDNDMGYSPDNCRWTDYSTQMRNKRTSRNRTGYRGVSKINASGAFIARIVPKYPDYTKTDRRILLGTFGTAIDAAKEYDRYIEKFDVACIPNGVLHV